MQRSHIPPSKVLTATVYYSKLANDRLPGKGQQIPRLNLDQISVFVIDNHVYIRTIRNQHLSAIPTRRDHTV